MDYLITGGAGFIGSHLADSLLARSERVTLLDNVSTGRIDNVSHLLERDDVTFVQGSILDEELVRKLTDGCDVVVHLAASVGVKLIVERPLETLMNNIRGTEIVMEACADLARPVLVASTSEIYGKNAHGPLHEDSDRILGSPFKARWSYSTGKAVDEILAYTYHQERGTPSVVVRLFNCVGPRQTGTYGMVLPTFVRQALTGDDITIYGTGEQSRCFCHVRDTVAALIALLDEPRAVGDVYNVGAAHEITMNGLAERVIELTGSSSRAVHIPYDQAYESGFEDMERRVPDTAKLEALTGWRPANSLEDIMRDVIEFERAEIAAGRRA